MTIANYRWKELADYNARVAKGIVHTSEYVERMRVEQESFDVAHAPGPCIVCGQPSEYTLSRGDRRANSCRICLPLVEMVEGDR
jgi:hypothetical protein